MYRHLLGVIALTALAACAGGDVVRKTPPEGYLQDAPARVAAVDWSTAQTVEVALTEYDFAPAALAFEASKPYRLLLRNQGSSTHTFTSMGFFQAIAAQKLVSGVGEEALPYIEKIEVPSGSSKELYFVAARAGSYPLECSVFLHDVFGMSGEITIR
jgi:uncharacterized cupredoxin-like copper-binding protein